MSTTTLEPAFLQTVLLLDGFKPATMTTVKRALLTLGLNKGLFTAADLDPAITQGSKHIAGAATGALVAMGLLVVVDRIKSPNPSAKGRRVDVLRIADGKRGTVCTWMSRN